MSTEKLIVVCYEKPSGYSSWLILSVKESKINFVAATNSQRQADLLRGEIEITGSREYFRRLKYVGISNKIQMANALKDEAAFFLQDLISFYDLKDMQSG